MYRLNQQCLSQIYKCNTKHRFLTNNSYIIQSPIPNIQIPDVTIPEHIFECCGAHPDKIAVECAITGRKYTYDALRNKALNLSMAIRKKLKLRKGDVVALLLPNIPEFPISLLGVLQASLIATTVSPLCTPEEIKRQLISSDAKALISTCSLYPLARASVSPSATIPILTIKSEKCDTTPEGSINFQEFTDNRLDTDLSVISSSSDCAIMPYSSGTTGFPKGALHTHFSMVANICQTNTPEVKIFEDTTDSFQDVVPAIIPFTHMYSLGILLLNSLAHTAKLVTMPKFKPDLFVDMFNKYKPTVLHAVPTALFFMTTHPSIKKTHFQSIRAISSAAASLTASDEERFLQKAGKDISILQGYGTTESGMLISNQKAQRCAGSVGIPLANTAVKVVSVDDDENSANALPSYKRGHLLVKGPQVMSGYYNRPKETESSFINGWMKTGDLGYYDDNHNFFIVDRLKELIKVKGYQVAPAELEDIIRGYPNVTDAVVIGIPHATYGEIPRAYITVQPGTQVNTNEIKQFVADKVSTYKDIKGGIAIVENLPKSSTGKILRRQLKLQYSHEMQVHTG